MTAACIALIVAASAFEAGTALPPDVQAALGTYRIATPADFIETVRVYAAAHPQEDCLRGLVTADFNGDGKPDYGIIGVEPNTREFKILFAVSQPDGSYAFPERRHYRGAFTQRGGIVYVALGLKPADDDRWADKLYSKLGPTSPQRAAYHGVPALAIWRSVGLDPYGRPDDYEASSLSYCRDVSYYVDGGLHSFMVCQ
jgi:hypothetical protein